MYEKIIPNIKSKFNISSFKNVSFKVSILAPNKAGMDKIKDILAASCLLKLRNLHPVITTPALLAPGIKAKIWNKPIKNILFKFKFSSNDFDAIDLSEKYKSNPKANVDHVITSIFLRFWYILNS